MRADSPRCFRGVVTHLDVYIDDEDMVVASFRVLSEGDHVHGVRVEMRGLALGGALRDGHVVEVPRVGSAHDIQRPVTIMNLSTDSEVFTT